MAKIYLITGIYQDADGYLDITTKACATRQIAEQHIKTMIDEEIKTQIENGRIERDEAGNVHFVDRSNSQMLEISDTYLLLDDGWGFCDNLQIEETELISA